MGFPRLPFLPSLLLATANGVRLPIPAGVSVAQHRRKYDEGKLQKLQHSDAAAFRFGRFRSPGA